MRAIAVVPIDAVDPLMASLRKKSGEGPSRVLSRLLRLGVMVGTLSLSVFLLKRERGGVKRPEPDSYQLSASLELGLETPTGFASDAGDLASLELSPGASVIAPGSEALTRASVLRNAAVQSTPAAVVYPTTAADVEACVRFARQRRLRVTMFATGHEYDGRSSGANSLNINTREMRWAKFLTPDLMSVGPGTTWYEVYAAALERGMVPVSGYDSSVGVIGFTSGGGHGPLSRQYGLGADHLVAARVVDASGRARNATGDWLWALKGGGGGTFGVVVEATIRLVPAPGRVTQLSYGVHLGERRPEILTRFIHNASFWETLPREWASWQKLQCSEGDGSLWMVGLFLHTGGEPRDVFAVEPMRSFRAFLDAATLGDARAFVDSKVHASIMDFEDTLGSLPLGRYERQFIGNVFVGPAHLDDNRLTDYVMDSMLRACDRDRAELFVYYNNVLGGAVRETGRDGETSVTDAFREALFELGPNAYWADPALDDAIIEASADLARGLNAISDSSYLNEWTSSKGANVMVDWRHRFWGDNYPKLLDVKRAVDPCNMFWVPHGVGSEDPVYATDACAALV